MVVKSILLKIYCFFWWVGKGILNFSELLLLYYTFAGVSFLVLNFILYEWISLFAKTNIHMIISIFANFSDFGLYFILVLLFYYTVTDYITVVKSSFKDMINNTIACFYDPIKQPEPFEFAVVLVVIIVVIPLEVTAIVKWPYIITVLYECKLLLSISVKTKDEIIKKSSVPELSIEEETNKNSEILEGFNYLNKKIFELPSVNEMLYKSRRTRLFGKDNLINRFIIIIIIFGLQLYSIVVPLIQGEISFGEFMIYLFVKIIFSEKILAFNLIDIILNWKKVISLLKKKNIRIVFVMTITIYAFATVSFFAVFIISKQTVFPSVDQLKYYEDKDYWYKFDENFSVNTESFCSTKSLNDGTLKTEDFAMLTTLPRLYGITDSGRCYIKPSKRGIFNSTMKYIFGRDYEKDNIRIFCQKLTHNPILVITSDKILNASLKHFSHTNITMLKSQFNVKNNDYFEDYPFHDTLSEEGRKLLTRYETCTSMNNIDKDKCDDEFEEFSQFYWSSHYSDKYEEIPGFERYQIPIEKDLIIQPSFITQEGKLMAGTHYIVGGSYEDNWGVGLFAETIGRKFIPAFLESFLPLYSFIRNMKKELFLRIERFNRHIFYFDVISTHEIEILENLLNQFNFTQESIFLVGHSISGTIFKGLSFSRDIHGIAFESSDGENNQNLLDKTSIKKRSNTESKITNIYSYGSIFTGNDNNCVVNGILPKRYILPNVYETACMTAITCSETKKYMRQCQQVLGPNEQDSMKEFNILFESYLKKYNYYKF